jgi:hypothetical protein
MQFRTWLLLILVVACSAGCQDRRAPVAIQQSDDPPPLEITFKESCGLPEGRQQVYDPKTGVFHVHFGPSKAEGSRGSGLYRRSGFEVTKAAEQFVKPVVFRLTGVPEYYGCCGDSLTLCVGGGYSDNLLLDGKSYPLVDDPMAYPPVDKTLFRVERQGEVVVIEFTEKGQALLKPGALVSFKLDHGW